jgi:hypothetical protein
MLAVFTTEPNRSDYRRALEAAGIRVIALPRETVRTWRGVERRGNSDESLLFEAGVLSNRMRRPDTFAIFSGDGLLSTNVAKGLRRHHGRGVRIVCFGIPGSIASEIARRTDLFDAPPIPLGVDCLLGKHGRASNHPSPHHHRTHHHE